MTVPSRGPGASLAFRNDAARALVSIAGTTSVRTGRSSIAVRTASAGVTTFPHSIASCATGGDTTVVSVDPALLTEMAAGSISSAVGRRCAVRSSMSSLTAGHPSTPTSSTSVAATEFLVSRYDEPEGWAAALSRLLGEDRTLSLAAREARRWSHTVHGPAACRASVNRLLGWARYEVNS